MGLPRLNGSGQGPTMQRMLSLLGRQVVALFIATGLCLSGALPAFASPGAGGEMPCAMMMPDIPMPASPTAAQKQAPMKGAPCDNAGCGCCVAGTCAMPAALGPDGSASTLFHVWEIAFLDESRDGISHPPSLPPPILRA